MEAGEGRDRPDGSGDSAGGWERCDVVTMASASWQGQDGASVLVTPLHTFCQFGRAVNRPDFV